MLKHEVQIEYYFLMQQLKNGEDEHFTHDLKYKHTLQDIRMELHLINGWNNVFQDILPAAQANEDVILYWFEKARCRHGLFSTCLCKIRMKMERVFLYFTKDIEGEAKGVPELDAFLESIA